MTRTSPVNSGYTIIPGTTTGSNGSKVDTWVEYKVTSQNVANNTSTVRVVLYSQATISSSTKWESASNFGYVGYDNGNKQYLSTTYDFSNKQVNKFGDYTYTIAHNSDGTKSVTLQGSWTTSHSTYISGGNASGSVTLPQIVRASSVSNFTGTLGTAGTITITRASTSFTHTLQYSFDNSNWTNIATNVGVSYSWTPNVSLISNFTNQKTKTGYLRCITYSGSTNVGSKTSTLTLTVPNSVMDSVTATIGNAVGLTLSNPCNSGLTYQFAYSDGSTWTNIGSAQTSKSISWSVPTSLIANISNAKSKAFSIRVTTKVGTAEVNTSTATATLTIPTATSSNVTGTIGSSVNIPIAKKHSNLVVTITHTLSNGTSYTIVSRDTSSSLNYNYSWSISNNLLTSITSSASDVGTLKVETFNGTASVGSQSYTLTLNVASSVKPTINSVAPTNNSPINANSTVAGWGIYLQGYSKVEMQVTASGVSGSSITNIGISGQNLNGSVNNQATLTKQSDILSSYGSFRYTATATDSRGRAATSVQSNVITVHQYYPPSLTGLSILRCQANGTEDSSGTYLKTVFTSSFASCNGHNSVSNVLQWKEDDDTSWTTYGAVTNGSVIGDESTLVFDQQTNYQTRILTSDALTSNITSTIINVPSSERILNVNPSGSGLAIGGFSTDAGTLQVYYPTDFVDDVPTIGGNNFIREAKGYALMQKTPIPANADLNDYLTAGSYYSSTNSDVQTMANCPTEFAFNMRVDRTIGQTPAEATLTWRGVIQTIWDYFGNTYQRAMFYNETALQIGAWAKTNIGFNRDYGSGSDLNNITIDGLYFISNNSGVANVPVNDYGFLSVRWYHEPTGTGYAKRIVQRFIRLFGQGEYRRVYANLQWRDWYCLYENQDYSTTVQGLTINARRRGTMCRISVSGTPSSAVATSGAYYDLTTLPDYFKPSLSPVDFAIYNATTCGQFIVTSAGVVRLGYTRDFSGNNKSLSGAIYLTKTYECSY